VAPPVVVHRHQRGHVLLLLARLQSDELKGNTILSSVESLLDSAVLIGLIVITCVLAFCVGDIRYLRLFILVRLLLNGYLTHASSSFIPDQAAHNVSLQCNYQ